MLFEEKQKLSVQTQNLSVEQKAVLFDLVYGRLHDLKDSDNRYTFLNAVKMAMDMKDFKEI